MVKCMCLIPVLAQLNTVVIVHVHQSDRFKSDLLPNRLRRDLDIGRRTACITFS